MIRLRFRGPERLLVGVSILGEAGILWTPLGANEVNVESLDALDDEQRSELVRLVRDPIDYVDDQGNQVQQVAPDGVMVGTLTVTESEAVHPPVAVDGTTLAVEVVGEEPPRHGQGSGRAAWVAFAERLTAAGIPVTVNDTMGRDEIVAAVDKAQEAHRGS